MINPEMIPKAIVVKCRGIILVGADQLLQFSSFRDTRYLYNPVDLLIGIPVSNLFM